MKNIKFHKSIFWYYWTIGCLLLGWAILYYLKNTKDDVTNYVAIIFIPILLNGLWSFWERYKTNNLNKIISKKIDLLLIFFVFTSCFALLILHQNADKSLGAVLLYTLHSLISACFIALGTSEFRKTNISGT